MSPDNPVVTLTAQPDRLSEHELERLEAAERLLRSRYQELLLAICLPIFIIVVALAVNQYLSERQGLLNELEQSSAVLGMAVDGITEVTGDHVKQMQMAFESCLRTQADYPGYLKQYLQPLEASNATGEMTLDRVPPEQRQWSGQLVNLDPQSNIALDNKLLNCNLQLHAMISLGAPVYYQGQFVGGVGTDVKLSTLQNYLIELPRVAGRLLLLDQEGRVLADTEGSPLNSMRPVSEALPLSLAELALVPTTGVRVDSRNDFTIFLRQSRNSPWTLVYLVREEELFSLLTPRIKPYVIILVVLALTLMLSILLLRRGFMDPALSLVGYLQRVSVDPDTVKPRLPRLWRVWADVISQTVAQHVNATRELYRSEERLQQILNNSSALVSVRGLDGRFISVNRAFHQLLQSNQTDVIGLPLEAVFPESVAQTINANEQQVIAQKAVMEFEERFQLQDGMHTYIANKFPLYDADAKLYAICSVSTDITKEKQSQAVLQEAAFGVSLAKGEEVFDVLVTHLAAAIGTRMALIGLLDENHEHIHTRALCNEGEITSNIIYSTQDSPCIEVVNNGYHCFTNDLTQCFPACNVVQTFAFESYAGVPLISSSGETLGILAILDDYSLPDSSLLESVMKIFAGRAVAELERERSHAALRDSEASYRAIFESSESAILIHEMDSWAILDVNPKASELYGYTREEMRAISIADISSGTVPYTMQQAVSLLQRAADGERLRFEWHCRKKDASLGWNEAFLRRASIGGHDRILAITHDISERKATEERLRSSEEQARQANLKLLESEAFKSAIVENALLAVITVNEAGSIVEFNPAAISMFGYQREVAIGKLFSDLIITGHGVHGHTLSLNDAILGLQTQLIGKRVELVAMNAAGNEFPVELSLSRSKRGDASFYTAFISDLSDKYAAEVALKSSEIELARQRDALRQSEKLSAMGALLAGVAHELNNPLAILMGRSALLQNKITTPSLLADVEKINVAAERCARIVHTFLSMARQRPTQRKPVQINDVVVAALDLLSYSLRAGDIELTRALAENLPWVAMDADQIGQVVMNLVVNAQQALENAPMPRCIHARTFLEGDYLCLRVTDNGPGIPAAVKKRIFDPFFTTKSEGVGTGVGLSVSRGIVREHGGEMLLEECETGASFLVRLPVTVAASVDTGPSMALGEDRRAGHALIVDDEPEVAELLGEILRSAGFQTTELPSGLAALAWLEQHHCDFILSDIRMQDIDGIALWRSLKERHPALAKRMAFVTGDTLSASVAPFLQESGLPGLDKPFTPESVLTLVAKLESL